MRSIGRLSWYRFQVWVFVRLLVCPSFVGGSHVFDFLPYRYEYRYSVRVLVQSNSEDREVAGAVL